ncbi:MAG: hypothetical protein PUJ35_08815 [Ruminococcus bromii]|nr:hypothetical protein [Ruminococcus bromii]
MSGSFFFAIEFAGFKHPSADWAHSRSPACFGLEQDAPQGFGNFLRNAIFSKAPFKSVQYINGQTDDPEAECR